MKKLSLACSVTSSHLKEFLLLKFSAEMFHECEWFVSCDSWSYEYLSKQENCHCQNLQLENGKVFGTEEEIDNFFGVIDGKFEAAARSIRKNGYALLVDTDIVFVNEVDYKFWEFLDSDSLVGASPHYQWNPAMDEDWGKYNVGFVLLKDSGFLYEWANLTRERKYKFEQVPIAKLLESGKYSFDEFPINYNMGWWRFNNQHSQHRLNSFSFGEKIKYDGHDVICFHFHSFVDCNHSLNFAKNIVPLFQSKNLQPLLKESNRISELKL